MIDKLNLREEWEALSPKIEKIATFVNSEDFNSLTPKEQALCSHTYWAMRTYRNTLRDILCAFKDNSETFVYRITEE